jgi:hypothetical protein
MKETLQWEGTWVATLNFAELKRFTTSVISTQ